MVRCIPVLMLFLGVLLFSECHKGGSVSPVNNTTQAVFTAMQGKLWSGYYSDTTFYINPPTSHYNTISNIMLSVQKTGDSTLSVPNLDNFSKNNLATILLKYYGTDSALQTIKYT